MSRGAVVAIVAGDFAVVGLVAGLLFCYFQPRLSGRRSGRRLQQGEKIVYSSSPYGAVGVVAAAGPGGATFERGKMVLLEDLSCSNGGMRWFELEQLLRASAKMLGKGGCGTTYKVVLDDGTVVAMKRLRDAAAPAGASKDFEHHMAVLGRLRHPNVVPLTASYYARDEKLLVYEYMPNGSLFSLLHGKPFAPLSGGPSFLPGVASIGGGGASSPAARLVSNGGSAGSRRRGRAAAAMHGELRRRRARQRRRPGQHGRPAGTGVVDGFRGAA